mmetsp:Transcript_31616/g.100377  ORF Transcript_31616/g.100377 Transcript_31616/m.100377 type:complete len:236 (-) Transcript_31616:1241-1948(-)
MEGGTTISSCSVPTPGAAGTCPPGASAGRRRWPGPGVRSTEVMAPVACAISQTSSRSRTRPGVPLFMSSSSDGSSSCVTVRRSTGTDAQALPPSVAEAAWRAVADARAKAFRKRVCARSSGQFRVSPMPQWSCMRSMMAAPCFSASPKFWIWVRARWLLATPMAMTTHVSEQMPTTACTAISASAVHSSKSSIRRVSASMRTKAWTQRRRFARSRSSESARQITSSTPPETCALT